MAVNVDVGFPFATIEEVQRCADATVLRKAAQMRKLNLKNQMHVQRKKSQDLWTMQECVTIKVNWISFISKVSHFEVFILMQWLLTWAFSTDSHLEFPGRAEGRVIKSKKAGKQNALGGIPSELLAWHRTSFSSCTSGRRVEMQLLPEIEPRQTWQPKTWVWKRNTSKLFFVLTHCYIHIQQIFCSGNEINII